MTTTPNPDAIGLFVNGSSFSIPTGTDRIHTTGYSQTGVGAAHYVCDSAVNATYVTDHPRAAFLDANGRGFRLSEPVWDFEMFGAIPDDSTDCYAAWLAMKDYGLANKVSASRSEFDYTSYAPSPVRFSGRYYSSQTWQVHLAWSFFAEVGGAGLIGGSHPVRLRFASNQGGIVINNRRSNGDQVTAEDTYESAAGTSLRGLAILGGGTDPTKHGIWARTRLVIENCSVDGFPGNGVNIVGTGTATTSGTNTQFGNCNDSIVNSLGISNVGRHGFFVDGADTNAGSFIAITVLSAGCAGIYEGSFLGNTYSGCAIHECGNAGLGRVSHGGNIYSLISEDTDAGKSTTPGTNNRVWYKEGSGSGAPAWSSTIDYVPSGAILALNPNNRSLIDNPYIEGGCPMAHADMPAIVIQPNMLTSWTVYTAYLYSNSGFAGCLTSPAGFSSFTSLSGSALGNYHAASLGGQREEGLMLKGECPNASTFRLTQAVDCVNITWENLDVSRTVRFHGPETSATFGRSTPQPYAASFGKFVLGDRHLGMISAVTDLNGTQVAKGEVYFNRDASAGGKVGWVVTTGGTVGSTAVLKPFGAIDA